MDTSVNAYMLDSAASAVGAFAGLFLAARLRRLQLSMNLRAAGWDESSKQCLSTCFRAKAMLPGGIAEFVARACGRTSQRFTQILKPCLVRHKQTTKLQTWLQNANKRASLWVHAIETQIHSRFGALFVAPQTDCLTSNTAPKRK